MHTIRYLNTVLTVIVILLTLQLWTLWSSPSAQTLSAAQTAHAKARPAGFPNAAAQRLEMVNLLKQQNRKTDELIGLFRSGKAKVKVERQRDQSAKR